MEDTKTDHKFHLPISVFKKSNNEKEYSNLEKILDKLIDEVRDNEKHPLAIAMQIIGDNLTSILCKKILTL
jgi:HTH-type transcriptional regulator/antitoxin HigA